MVTKLVKTDFIEKEPAAHSNNELQLTLTQQGWQAFRIHEKFHGQHMADVVDRVGAFSIS